MVETSLSLSSCAASSNIGTEGLFMYTSGMVTIANPESRSVLSDGGEQNDATVDQP